MASGDLLVVLLPTSGVGPTANPAVLDLITGANTESAELIDVVAFDGGATEELWDYYNVYMPDHYGGNGVTVEIVTSGTADPPTGWVFGVAFRKITDDADDLDAEDHTYDYNVIICAKPSTIGEVVTDSVNFSDGADMDSVGAGSHFFLRVRRDTSHASDDMSSNDAYLHKIVIREQS